MALRGDVGDSGSRIDATGRAVVEIDTVQPFDGLVILGDNVDPSGYTTGLDDTVFDPFAEVLDHAPLFAISGITTSRTGTPSARSRA